MPRIDSYDPSINVTDTDVVVQLSLDDWYPKPEVLKKLGKAFGVRSMKELIKKLQGPARQAMTQGVREGIIKCELEQGSTGQIEVLSSQSLE